VEVRTNQRALTAEKVVVTTGAYARQLLGSAVLVQPVRKVLFWYDVQDSPAFDAQRFPCWIAQSKGQNFYGFPTLDRVAVKAAEDTGGQALADPHNVNRELRPEDEANLRLFLDALFAKRLGPRMRHKTCLYEKTPDDHFIVDVHPEHPNVILAVGGSGHGFKFCSAIGELAADLVTIPNSHAPPLFRASRFADSA
jgi:glycine/D-amino acid oxidase-like deaminating enzyme